MRSWDAEQFTRVVPAMSDLPDQGRMLECRLRVYYGNQDAVPIAALVFSDRLSGCRQHAGLGVLVEPKPARQVNPRDFVIGSNVGDDPLAVRASMVRFSQQP